MTPSYEDCCELQQSANCDCSVIVYDTMFCLDIFILVTPYIVREGEMWDMCCEFTVLRKSMAISRLIVVGQMPDNNPDNDIPT